MRMAAISTAALLAAGGFIMVQAVSAEAGGATRYVAVTGDDSENDCTVIASPCRTISHAVDEADAHDTVSIAPGRYDETVHIRTSLTLVGAGTSGADKTTVDGNQDGGTSIWVDGFDSDSTPVVTVSHLDVSGNPDSDGIEVDFGSVEVRDSVVSDNDEDGIRAGVGSTVAVANSTVSNNGGNGIVLNGQTEVDRPSEAHAAASASDTAARVADSDVSNNNLGGIQGLFADITVDDSLVNANGNGGVVIGGGGTATVNRSTLDGDRAVGAVAIEGGTLVVNDSTVSNTQPSGFEEEEALGAGIAGLVGGTVHVNQSTVYRSTNDGVLSVFSTVTVKNSTVVGTKDVAGDLFGLTPAAVAVSNLSLSKVTPTVQGLTPKSATITPHASDLPDSELTVQGTLIAGNAVDACSEGVTDSGYNLSDDKTCSFDATGKNDGVAKLGTFGLHGGATKTFVPTKGSDAIDKIPAGKAGCTSNGTDQRDQARLQGPKCDIGSVEAHQTPIVVTPGSLANATVGKAYSVTFTASGGLGGPYSFFLAGGTLPDGVTLSPTGVLSGTPTEPGTYRFTLGVDDPTFFDYTLVVVGGSGNLADTGTRVAPLVTVGSTAVGLGVLLMLAAGYSGRRRREQ